MLICNALTASHGVGQQLRGCRCACRTVEFLAADVLMKKSGSALRSTPCMALYWNHAACAGTRNSSLAPPFSVGGPATMQQQHGHLANDKKGKKDALFYFTGVGT